MHKLICTLFHRRWTALLNVHGRGCVKCGRRWMEFPQ